MQSRKTLYAALGIARRDLGWTEERYRQHLSDHGATFHRGRPSAATLSHEQLEAALQGLKAEGWHSRPAGILSRCHRDRQGQWRKIIALWCTLADAGVVHDRSDAAMLTWCARHVNADRIEWADSHSLNRCIEGLKAWAERNGVEIQ